MKLKDDATLSIAAAVSDVLEGKVKEEGKYPHDMFHPETGEKKVAKDEAEHKALADKGYTHDKPEVDEVAEPKAKGEKDFKDKHTVKKTYGPGTVKEEAAIAIKLLESVLVEALDRRKEEKLYKDIYRAIDKLAKLTDKMPEELEGEEGYDEVVAAMNSLEYGIRYYPDALKAYFENNESVKEVTSKFPKALLKKATDLALKMGGNMTGAVNKIEKMKKGLSDDPEVKAALQMANEEVTGSVMDEAYTMNEAKSKMAEDKERYQKFFKSALKKFGVTSPGELEGEKKKEFFNYVDKNYEADNETDKDESVKEGTIAEAQIRTSFESDEMKNTGGDTAAKKLKIKISFKKGKGDGYMGSDAGIFTGDEKNLVKYFQDYMGFDGKTFKELQKVYEGTIAEAFVRTFFSSDEMDNVGGDKAAKKMGIKVKVDKGKGDNKMGEDRGLFTGDEKALVKYFQDYFGFEGKNFKELKKEFHK